MITAPVVLLGHGSPDPRSSAGLRTLCGLVSARLPRRRLQVAFLDHQRPTLDMAVDRLASMGCQGAVVVPMFLSNAFHARTDVPLAAAAAQASTGVRLLTTPPLGTDARLLDALDRHVSGGRPVVLATAGTSDAAAQADLDALALTWSLVRDTEVMVAYASQSRPSIAEAIEALRGRTGQEPDIASFMLFDGVLADRIREAAAGLICSPVLGAEPELVDLVVERITGASPIAADR